MVDHPRRYRIHLEVGHKISTDHHGTFLHGKCLDYLCEGIRSAIYIITVKLYGIFSAFRMVDRHIPASAYTQIISVRNHMHKPAIP